MLSGKEICVMSGTAGHPKSELEKSIVSMGGTVVQNPGTSNFVLYLHTATVDTVLVAMNYVTRRLHIPIIQK